MTLYNVLGDSKCQLRRFDKFEARSYSCVWPLLTSSPGGSTDPIRIWPLPTCRRRSSSVRVARNNSAARAYFAPNVSGQARLTRARLALYTVRMCVCVCVLLIDCLLCARARMAMLGFKNESHSETKCPYRWGCDPMRVVWRGMAREMWCNACCDIVRGRAAWRSRGALFFQRSGPLPRRLPPLELKILI